MSALINLDNSGEFTVGTTLPTYQITDNVTLTPSMSLTLLSLVFSVANFNVTFPTKAIEASQTYTSMTAGMSYKFVVGSNTGPSTVTLVSGGGDVPATFSGYVKGIGAIASAASVVIPSTALVGDTFTVTSQDAVNWVISGSVGRDADIVPILAAGGTRAVTAADFGKTLTVDQSAGAAVYTLPAVAASTGGKVKFIIKAAGANSITIRAPAGKMKGIVSNSGIISLIPVVVPVVVSNTDLVFTNNQALGSWAEVLCDGTYWYVSGQSGTSGGFTTA